jgi:peptidoglycan/LPS O-acetylase OafA/YrhL
MESESHHRTFAEVLDANRALGPGFGTLRLVAACAVFLAHSLWLTSGQFDFVYSFSRGQTFIGSMAVGCFFVISGFLVMESLQKSRSLVSFAIKRALRIFPGLIVAVALTALLLGPMVTTLGTNEYFGNVRVYYYLANAIFFNELYLPGVFTTHVITAVNASLWTLRYEVFCYGMLALLGYLKVSSNRYVVLALTIFVIPFGYFATGDHRVYLVSTLKLLILPHVTLSVGPALRLAPYFFAGMTFNVWRNRLWFDWRLAALSIAACVAGLRFGFHDISFPLCGGYLVIFIGLSRCLDLSLLRDRDYSYGIYIYACPIQQLVIDIFYNSSWWINAFASAPLILCCAMISWNCIERPAIQLKHRLRPSQRLTSVPISNETLEGHP